MKLNKHQKISFLSDYYSYKHMNFSFDECMKLATKQYQYYITDIDMILFNNLVHNNSDMMNKLYDANYTLFPPKFMKLTK